MLKPVSQVGDMKSDSSEIATKIYRAINDLSRQLDDLRARAQSVKELFLDNVFVQRVKLRDYCDKLMFTDPVNFGKKAEDVLWKKSFYEVVTTIKLLNKKKQLPENEKSLVYFHLQSGIGHYHHLIMKLQTHFRLDLRGAVDFPLMITDRGLKKEKQWCSSKPIELGGLEWAQEAVGRCLIYLGDLSRYLMEFSPTFGSSLPHRYYAQAFIMKPETGVPHNQLGSLSLSVNYGLDSAYHYMRSISCLQKFEGSEMNYRNLCDANFEKLKNLKKSSVVPAQSAIINFIHITYCLFYDQLVNQNEIQAQLVKDLQLCFSEMQNPVEEENIEQPKRLNEFMLFKMMVMIIICAQRLKAKGSRDATVAVTLGVSLSCHCLELAVLRLAEVLTPRSEPASHNRLRRRRQRRLSNCSDLTDDDSVYSSGSDPGEEDLIFDQCNKSDDEAANGECSEESDRKRKDTLREELQPWTHHLVHTNKQFVHLHRLSNTGFILQTVKIIFDWFSDIKFAMKRNGVISSTDSLIANFITFMSHLTAVPSLKKLQEYLDEGMVTAEEIAKTPLPEDICVKGLAALKTAQASLMWDMFNTKSLHPKQQTYVRIVKLINFAQHLASLPDSPIVYNESKEWFSARQTQKNGFHKEKEENNTAVEGVVSSGKEDALIKNLAEMWLRSEVNSLQSKVRKAELPPYLIVDLAALLHHGHLVKRLAAKGKASMVIVPMAVVRALDEEKTGPVGCGAATRARQLTRWMEQEVSQGSRTVRFQRDNEHAPIPFIKYPKKKDRDACLFIQVVECAYYLSTLARGEKDSGMVTLLTGSTALLTRQNGFSPVGVAKSAGINVEYIESFFSKWKASSKSHG